MSHRQGRVQCGSGATGVTLWGAVNVASRRLGVVHERHAARIAQAHRVAGLDKQALNRHDTKVKTGTNRHDAKVKTCTKQTRCNGDDRH